MVGWRGESYVPPIGGKRMERRQRKQSVPHIMKAAVYELNVVLGWLSRWQEVRRAALKVLGSRLIK